MTRVCVKTLHWFAKSSYVCAGDYVLRTIYDTVVSTYYVPFTTLWYVLRTEVGRVSPETTIGTSLLNSWIG